LKIAAIPIINEKQPLDIINFDKGFKQFYMKNYKKYVLAITFIAFLFFQYTASAQTPASENICGAPLIKAGLSCSSFTNKGSTASSLLGTPPCWASAPSNDVWVSFVATAPDMSVSTDVALFDPFNSGGNLTDTKIAIYKTSDNTCNGTPTLVGCDEDSGINSLLNGTTLLSIAEMTGLVTGNTYFIRIDGNGFTPTGAFCLSVYDTYTPGSKPCEAQVVHPNNSACDTLNGNKVVNATSSNTTKVNGIAAGTYLPLGKDYCGADNETAQYGTWTTFVANNSGSVTVTNYAPTAVDYTLFSGNCVNMTCIGSQQAAISGNTIFTGIVSGTTYYILTTLQNGATTDAVSTDLCVTNNVPPSHPLTPKNDGTGGSVDPETCASAYGVTIDKVYQTSTYGSASDGPASCNKGNNVWFYWQVPATYPSGPVFFQLWNKNCTGGPGNPGITLYVNPDTVCSDGCVEVTTPKSDQNTNVGWDSKYGKRFYLNFTGGGSGENCDFNFMVGSLPIINGVKVYDDTICNGETATLTALGGTTYQWSTLETTESINVNPTTTTAYTVTAITGAAGSDVSTVTVFPASSCPTGTSCAKTYTKAGSFVWTAPSCVTSAIVECWGGGGAGGGATGGSFANANKIGGGGGGGAYTKKTITVVPGTNYDVFIGAAAKGSSGNGIIGATSTFGLGGTVLVSGAGGGGGTADTGQGGAGGVGTFNGGKGSSGESSSGSAGGGGGGAGTTGSGADAASGGAGTGGVGGTGGGGDGGVGGPTDGSNGVKGKAIAGGGGGADAGINTPTNYGGDGSVGKVLISCIQSSTTITVNNATICSGQNTTLLASGATSYTWSAGSSTTNTLTVSPTSTTSYSVSDGSGGCSNTAVSTVTVVASVTVTVNNATICNGQNATLTASGATDYIWSSGSSTTNPLVVTPVSNISYTVIGTTSGCSDTAVANVTVGGGGAVTVNSATICSGKTATLNASGGTNYTWSPSTNLSASTGASVTATPTVTTSYSVTDNASSCGSPGVSVVTVNSQDDASFTYFPATVCKTGGSDPSPSITGTSGGTFSCTPALTINATSGLIDLASTPVATYTVTYTTAGVCPATKTFVLSIVSAADATFSYTGSYCQNATPNATPTFGTNASAGTFSSSGGLTFKSTATGEIDLTLSSPNTYTVTNTIAASGSCLAATSTATVTINASPTVTVNNQTVCSGTSGILTASGAITYTWVGGGTPSGGTLTDTPVTTKSYTVTGSSNGCSSTSVGTINVNQNPQVGVVLPPAAVCPGTPTMLTATGATTYTWAGGGTPSGASLTDSPAITTTYTVTGAIGTCTATVTGAITIGGSPNVTTANATICSGSTGATLTANGGLAYTWSTTPPQTTQSITVNPLVTTTYTVTGTGSTAGCNGVAYATVVVNTTPSAAVAPAPGTICAGASYTLTASPAGAASYNWSWVTGTSVLNPLIVTSAVTTVYTVTVTAAGGCFATASGTVNVIPSTTVGVNNATICSGQKASLTATGAAFYSWSPNIGSTAAVTTPTLTLSTNYTVTGNAATCPTKAVASVKVNASPTTGVNSSTICLGESTTLTASGANTYTWLPTTGLNPTTGSIVKANPTTNITYSVTGTAANGCTKNALSLVVVNTTPIVNPGTDVTIDYPSSTQLLANGGGTYSWTPALGLSCTNCSNPIASPTVTTTYCVKVTDANNCVDSGCVTITVEIPCIVKNLEVPTAFSPNGDGISDVWTLNGWEKCISNFTVTIYDRWGEKVFESNDPTQSWNGIYRGKPLEPAVFVYFISATLPNKEKITKKGNITLVF
jgi:gliding motility-associated-like protein